MFINSGVNNSLISNHFNNSFIAKLSKLSITWSLHCVPNKSQASKCLFCLGTKSSFLTESNKALNKASKPSLFSINLPIKRNLLKFFIFL